jgi:hypothetical protein
MDPTLPEWLVLALPQPLRAHVRAFPGPRRPARLSLVFERPGQPRRVIDAYLLEPGGRALARFGPIGFGYRVDEAAAVDHRAEAEFCKAVATALATHAHADLLAYLHERPDPHADPPPAQVSEAEDAKLIVNEYTLVRLGVDAALAPIHAVAGAIAEVELFLVSACVQACSFCVFPQVRGSAHQWPTSPDAVTLVRAILAELRARPGPSRVVLSGPDCLRHPQIDAMLEQFADEQDIGLELLGPLTRLSEPALAARVASLPSLKGVRLSLFGASAEIHDRVVGQAGAHAQVLAALAHCRALGIAVGLATVLTPENVGELPELLALVASLGLRTQLSLYHPESWSGTPLSWREVDLARTVVGPAALLAACERIDPALARAALARYIPHCWVPGPLRPILLAPAVDRQDDFAFVPGCAGCPARPECPGISRPAIERLGPDCAPGLTADARR